MRPAALASLGLIGFLALALAGTAQAQPAPVTPAPAAAPAAPAARPDGKAAATRPDGRASPAEGTTPGARPSTPERTTTHRRRRPSYATCNRASQRRNLHGGARRRFLIRCRLGYERIQPGQPARTRP